MDWVSHDQLWDAWLKGGAGVAYHLAVQSCGWGGVATTGRQDGEQRDGRTSEVYDCWLSTDGESGGSTTQLGQIYQNDIQD